jgi:hypothetical protein
LRWEFESRLRGERKRPSWSPRCSEFISAYGGMAGVAGQPRVYRGLPFFNLRNGYSLGGSNVD